MEDAMPADPIEAEVDRQLAGFRDLLPPAALEALRGVAAEVLADDPVLCEMLRQLTPEKPVLRSGERAKGDDAVQQPADKKPAAGG